VIVEGNMDVVSSHQAGVKQVVATAGTAMTENHLRALRRLTGNIRLAFDGDKAGLAATERAVPIASAVGVDLMIITLPDGAKDPDELIQKDVGLWQNAIDTAMPAVDWILEQYKNREDVTSATGKRTFTTAALAIVKGLGDPVEREHYEQKIAAMIGSSLEAVQAKVGNAKSEAKPLKSSGRTLVPESVKNEHAYQDDLLSLALIDTASQNLLASVDGAIFAGDARQEVAAYLSKHGGEALTETPEALQKYDTYVKILLLKADARYASWNEPDRQQQTARLLRQTITEHKKQTRDTLIKQLREAEAGGNDETAGELRTQLNALIKEISRG
jgi:DNA primase